MFDYTRLSDADLAAEYTLWATQAADVLREYGPAGCDQPAYQQAERALSTIRHIQQQRAERTVRQAA